MLPNGIEFHKGSLYVATPKDITRYDNIEDKLDKPGEPVMIYDKLPGDDAARLEVHQDRAGRQALRAGGRARATSATRSDEYAQIRRMNLDGSGMEIVARGVRNTVGFDFHPKTGELWFTDNGRDWLSRGPAATTS